MSVLFSFCLASVAHAQSCEGFLQASKPKFMRFADPIITKDIEVIIRSLPKDIRAGLYKALSDINLKIVFADRMTVTKLGFPEYGAGFFSGYKTTPTEFLPLADRLRQHFNVLKTQDMILIVQDTIKLSKVQEQTALVHELGHFVFSKVILENKNPTLKMNEILESIGLNPIMERSRLDFLNEVHSHTYEVLAAKAISDRNKVNWFELFYDGKNLDFSTTLRQVTGKVKNDYEFNSPLILSASEVSSLVSAVLKEYVR